MKKLTKENIKFTLILLAFPVLFVTGIYLRKYTSDFWYNLFF
jgi:ABC-type phosphate transport system permease subunit